jgi:hypothetical protein
MEPEKVSVPHTFLIATGATRRIPATTPGITLKLRANLSLNSSAITITKNSMRRFVIMGTKIKQLYRLKLHKCGQKLHNCGQFSLIGTKVYATGYIRASRPT